MYETNFFFVSYSRRYSKFKTQNLTHRLLRVRLVNEFFFKLDKKNIFRGHDLGPLNVLHCFFSLNYVPLKVLERVVCDILSPNA